MSYKSKSNKEQTRIQKSKEHKLIDTDNSMLVTGGKRVRRVNGLKYMVMDGDMILGGWHTMQYTDHVSYTYTLRTHIILLTNVNPINLT